MKRRAFIRGLSRVGGGLLLSPLAARAGFVSVAGGRGLPMQGGGGGGGGTSTPTFSVNPYRTLTFDQTANPFKSDSGLTDTKHVAPMWHPIKRRVFTNGGDFGSGAGPTLFGQPRSGASSSTNDPVSPQTYTVSSGYRRDPYSMDPYASTATIPWRLEHPYWPRNVGGVREVRPPLNCQDCFVWDSLRSKMWLMQTFIRGFGSSGAGYGNTDEWAYGDLFAANHAEPPGVYSFTPGASGSPGAYVLETTNALVCKTPAPAHPTYNGGRLEVGNFDERIAFFEYDATSDRIVTMSAYSGPIGFFSFDPAAKTWEWRELATGWSFIGLSSTQLGIVNGWLYGVTRATISGVRKSMLVGMNISAILALANGGTIPNNSTYWKSWQLPWSLSPNAEWEAGMDNAKYQEHAGVIGDNEEGKVIVCTSYDLLTDSQGTKMAAFVPSNETFYPADTCPDVNWNANAWVKLPDTHELLMMHGTFGAHADNVALAYRYTHLGPLSLDSFNSNEGTDPIVNGDSGGLAYWTSLGVTPDGKLDGFGAGTHSGNIDNGVREWNPNVGGVSTYLKASNNSTCDVAQYNNHAWFFFKAINSIVVLSQGVYDRNVGDWVAGNLARCSGPPYSKVAIGTGASAIVYADSTVDFNAGTGKWDYINGGSTLYNAHTAYSEDYDCAVMIGGTPGTASGVVPNIHLIVPSVSGINTTAVSQGNRYTIYRKALPATVSGERPYKGRARDACAFAGEYVYWVGGDDPDTTGLPTPHFWRMKITPHLSSKTASLTTGAGAIERLTDCPVSFTFGLMMYDRWLNAMLLVTDKGIYAYDLTYSLWVNVTPANYNSALFDNKGIPFGCMGGFIDKTGTTTHRRFYWRPGYQQLSPGNYWDDVPLVAKRITIMSLALKRS